MKKSLFLVVALFALASLMAAMAFSSAQLENEASFTLTNTEDSLLALNAGDHNAAYILQNRHGSRLVVNFDKGYDNGDFGLQQDSEYVWNSLFSITNNSEKNVKVTLPKLENVSGALLFVKLADEGENAWQRVGGQVSRDAIFNFNAGEEAYLDWKIVVLGDINRHGFNRPGQNWWAGERTPNITVIAEVQE